jgi:molybdopterin-biosynthesis enzyme MoeA-like protein
MKTVKIILAGTAALITISSGGLGPTSPYGNGYQS